MGYFEQVGNTVAYGEVRITPDDAEAFAQSALRGTRIRTLYMDDDMTYIKTSSYATGVLSDAAADYDISEDAYIGETTYGLAPAYSLSRMTFARYRAKNRNTKIYTIYEIEKSDHDLLLARRQVRIIRNLSRLAIRKGEPVEEEYARQYKVFERPITPEDVATVIERVDRTIRRQAASKR